MNYKPFLKINYFLLCILITITSCKKEEPFFNLTSVISSENKGQTVVEGDKIIINLNLSEELSEDLPLLLDIVDDVPNFINPEDYDKTIQFKGNLDNEWRTASGNTLYFPKRNTSLKIRFATHDDALMETEEAFHAVIKLDTSKTDNDFMVMGINEIEPPLISVEDNDGDPDTIGEGTVDFIVDDDFNFSLASVSQERPYNRFEKYFIDYISKDGLPQHIYEDLKRVLKSGVDIPIRRFAMLYDPSLQLGGFVYFDLDIEGWIVALNIAYAFPDIFSLGSFVSDPQTSEEFDQLLQNDYNKEGIFGYVLVHEYGHLATLNYETQIDYVDYFEENVTDCSTYSNFEGCTKPESVINGFYDKFYKDSPELNSPSFVTEYASSILEEDLAECFAFSIVQNEIPDSDEFSSGALQKINFVGKHEQLSSFNFRSFREDIHLGLLAEYFQEGGPILNYSKHGKPLLCTDHKKIIESLAERRKAYLENN